MGAQSKRQKQLDRRRYGRLVAALGCIVVLATAIALMVPALSMTRGALVCGLEEHQHSETCYQKVLACGQDESADHVHTDACYERRLACELPEHAHGDACYERVVVQGEGVDGEQDAADDVGVADAGENAEANGPGGDVSNRNLDDVDTASIRHLHPIQILLAGR